MGICVSQEEKLNSNLPTSQINNQKLKKNSNHASYYYQNSQLKDSIFQTSPNCSETQSIGSTNASVLMEKKNSQSNNPLQFSNLLQSNLKNKKQITKQDDKEDTDSQNTEFFSIDGDQKSEINLEDIQNQFEELLQKYETPEHVVQKYLEKEEQNKSQQNLNYCAYKKQNQQLNQQTKQLQQQQEQLLQQQKNQNLNKSLNLNLTQKINNNIYSPMIREKIENFIHFSQQNLIQGGWGIPVHQDKNSQIKIFKKQINTSNTENNVNQTILRAEFKLQKKVSLQKLFDFLNNPENLKQIDKNIIEISSFKNGNYAVSVENFGYFTQNRQFTMQKIVDNNYDNENSQKLKKQSQQFLIMYTDLEQNNEHYNNIQNTINLIQENSVYNQKNMQAQCIYKGFIFNQELNLNQQQQQELIYIQNYDLMGSIPSKLTDHYLLQQVKNLSKQLYQTINNF